MSSETPEQGKGPPARPPRPSRMADVSQQMSEEEFEATYHNAYKYIDRGITLVTQGQKDQAGALFQQGLDLIDKLLSIKVESISSIPEKVQQYTEIHHKIRCTRKQVLVHFAEMQSEQPSGGIGLPQPRSDDAPPSYDDYLRSLEGTDRSTVVVSSDSSAAGSTSERMHYPNLSPLLSQVGDLSADETIAQVTPIVTPVMSPQNGEMIFQIENGVQIFFIYPEGRVTSPSYPSFLAVFTLSHPVGGGTEQNYARGFLQVGEWSYPLVPAQSPVLHSFYGAYMFPDVTNQVPGTSVGIIIPDSVDQDTRLLFEQILMQMTSYQEQKTPEGVDPEQKREQIQQSTSERIATGAEAVSKGVVWGAERLTQLISYSSDKIKESIQPEVEKRQVDPKWQKTASVARSVSGTAVRVSGYLLGQIGKATMALGRQVAPHLKKHGTRTLTHLTGQKETDATAQVEGVMEVAAGAIKGASTVYMSLENAATMLACSLTDNTVKVVSHKYGDDAAAVTGDTLYAVGQTAMAGHNIASLGVKGIAKRAAKDTGKALVIHYEENRQEKVKPKGSREEHPITEGVDVAEEAMETEAVQPYGASPGAEM